MSEKRTFVECLRHNIKYNWSEGGLFESMTKNDCLKACTQIEQLQIELEAANKRWAAVWPTLLAIYDDKKNKSGDKHFESWLQMLKEYLYPSKGKNKWLLVM